VIAAPASVAGFWLNCRAGSPGEIEAAAQFLGELRDEGR
jgi:hypothetical protein